MKIDLLKAASQANAITVEMARLDHLIAQGRSQIDQFQARCRDVAHRT